MKSSIIILAVGLIVLSVPAFASCPELHHDYAHAAGPKAFAIGVDGGCGYATARSASSLRDARRRAMEACEGNSHGCKVTEESDD